MEDNKPDFTEINKLQYKRLKGIYTTLEIMDMASNSAWNAASERYKKELEERDKEIERLKNGQSNLNKLCDAIVYGTKGENK
jgi:uncharacterized protein YeaO (DUF488 family)